MVGTSRGRNLAASRGLPLGLLLSAGLLAVIGGRVGLALAALQLAAAGAVFGRPEQPGRLASAALTLAVAPLSAAIHWMSELPGGCRCQRVADAPGLVSLTGLAFLIDLLLVGLAVWAASGSRWENPPVSDHEPTRGSQS